MGSDGGSNKAPGGLYTGTDPHVAPGALLAIPASAASGVKTTTVAGGKIKRALVEYGGYIVDDTGGGNSAAICMEVSARPFAQIGASRIWMAQCCAVGDHRADRPT